MDTAQTLARRRTERGPGAARLDETRRRVVFHLPPACATDSLSGRELDVLALVASGQTDAQIAARLAISPRTVSTHVSNMLNKTGYSNRIQLVIWAIGAEVIRVTPQM